MSQRQPELDVDLYTDEARARLPNTTRNGFGFFVSVRDSPGKSGERRKGGR
jgi:hypothetical protein